MIAAVVVLGLASLLVIAMIAWPLIMRPHLAESVPAGDDERRQVEEDLERSLAAIREITQDHRVGHLSDEDFAALDRDERARAVELMRRRDALPPA
ncbi:MAG: hypothetical protein QOD86_325 [Miltoncostaeaceae bacterium]|nr:hypothetical protein [Miltoncostaeaceae bacterium]